MLSPPPPRYIRLIHAPRFAMVASLTVLLAGCGGSHTGSDHIVSASTGGGSAYTGDGVTTRSSTYQGTNTTLRITVSTPQSVYAVGMPIPATVTIANVGTGTYTYTLCGLNIYATAAVAPVGGTLWTSTYGTAIPAACQANVTLAPGESVSDQVVWNQNIDAGGTAPQGTYALNLVSGRLPFGDAAATIPALFVGIENSP